ncbi:hypothetical protein BGW42_003032 [Actinomortierella wolfii]|nr:hypothetical protein BGW42_003032 [Actinomortierella wolfii]
MVQHVTRGQSNAGRGSTSARGGGSRGGGRGRGPRYSNENITEIVAKRTTSLQVGSDATDNLLIAPKLDPNQQHLAYFYLSIKDFDGFRTQRQIRDFVHSLLVNLSNHHSVDTSGLLTSLSSPAGLSRLREILQHRMYINAGFERDRMSFQYVVLPLIGVLTREKVCQSVLTQESGRIYAEVYYHRQEFLDEGVLPCMRELINRGSMDDTSSVGRQLRADESLLQVVALQRAMLAVVRLVYQLVKRVQNAKTEMIHTVSSVRALAKDCTERSDTSQMSQFLNQHLERECQRLHYMVSAPVPSVVIPARETIVVQFNEEGPNLPYLRLVYDPPGSLSPNGPRHDNDHAQIKDIKIIPTQDELTCTRPPFLPSNDVDDAPHHLPPGWARLLDIHFRLNREDMIDQLRKGIMAFLEALRKTAPDQQGALLNRRELRRIMGSDVSLYAYGNVKFIGTNVERHLQGSIKISFDHPPQIKNQSGRQRETFWTRSKKRLMQGSLVCFIYPAEEEEREEEGEEEPQAAHHNRNVHLSLGVITYRDIREMAKDPEKAVINITLTDPTEYCRFVSATNSSAIRSRDCLMVESMGGFFEAYRPILKALQTHDPGDMPFGKYLAPTEEQESTVDVVDVDPPLYARAPGFNFDLSILLQSPVTYRLDVQDPLSRQQAVVTLRAHSTLDDTQSQALVDSLCREVALISGPPGTGKTKIGVDIMRVLVHNAKDMYAGPILCICYTNHALDQFLEHLLDHGINNLVRIGSRSQSQKLHQYGLNELMRSTTKDFAARAALAQAYQEWEVAAKELKEVDKNIRRPKPLLVDILRHARMDNEYQYIELLKGDGKDDPDEEPKTIEQNYNRWSTGIDLAQMEKENRRMERRWTKAMRKATKKREKILEEAMENGLDEWEIENALADIDEVPEQPTLLDIPSSDRPLIILRDANIWTMSLKERERLQGYWAIQAQTELQVQHTRLHEKIQLLSKCVTQAHDEIRRGILRRADVIGMTTNGAAKFHSMVAALSPKIIICEEAGEVLESHILAALSGSTQHLILIGDHLQLRPQIATYTLSSDSHQGRNYNLDRSLFERLVKSRQIPSSPLTIQRRMRPEICNLIRNTLYPDLIDNDNVLQYPDVSGMATNVFFMNHRHPEDSRDQYGIQSYANTFEAEMVKALILHLIKNGYQQSCITVLTPYLGQLSRLRDTLNDIVRLAIDDRDQEQLDVMTDGTPSGSSGRAPWKYVSDNRTLTLRTIDNFQGEEADIIIISLVRSDTREDRHEMSSTIGFLKSPNRTNVLLSRARLGLYMIGNETLMDQRKNGMWPKIMSELRENDRIGDGFLLRCRNHPESAFLVCYPADFTAYAPNGGWTMNCSSAPNPVHVCILNAIMSVPKSVDKIVVIANSLLESLPFHAVIISLMLSASNRKTHQEFDAKFELYGSFSTVNMTTPWTATRIWRHSSATRSVMSSWNAAILVPGIAINVRNRPSKQLVYQIRLHLTKLWIELSMASVNTSVGD